MFVEQVAGRAMRPGASPPEPVRVLLADDTPTRRLLLRRTLEASQAFVVVGEAADGAEAVALAETLQARRGPARPVDAGDGRAGGPTDDPGAGAGGPGGRAVRVHARRHGGAGATAYIEKQQRPDELVAGALQAWRSGVPEPVAPERLGLGFASAPVGTAIVGPTAPSGTRTRRSVA